MSPTLVPHLLSLRDLFLGPIYILLVFLIVWIWRNKKYAGSPLRKFIYPALICRLAGCILLTFLYDFYYGYGDTFGYYTGARETWLAFVTNPKLAWEIIVKPAKDYSQAIQLVAGQMSYTGFSGSSVAMLKISSVVGLLSFGSYLPIAIWYSLLSFFGTWMIYIVFAELYPHLYKKLAIGILFVPSVVIWTTGILKEPLCMFGLGLCFYSFYNLLKKNGIFRNILAFIAGSIILLSIKDYIFYSFIVGAILWSYSTLTGNIHSTVLRILVKAIIVLIFFISAAVFINSTDFVNEKIAGTLSNAETLQNAMKVSNENSGGSSYTISSAADVSFGGLVQSFLLSLNVSLFRPYIWECKNVFMLMNFLEGFITTILVILLFFKAGLRKTFFYTRKSPVLLFSIVFSILMAVMAGFISFNFGTLIRYKTPFLPFFFSYIIIILYDKTWTSKKRIA
jgi:hypothetical protein